MASYKQAVQWIADNDDADLGDPAEGGFIISIVLVADLFKKEPHVVAGNVWHRREQDRLALRRQERAEEAEEDRMMDAAHH